MVYMIIWFLSIILMNIPQVAMNTQGSIFLPSEAFEVVEANHTKNVEYCSTVHPKAKDVVRRFYTLFIYFDQYALNRDFVNRYRHAISQMADNAYLKNKHAAYMVTILTPLIFLREYDDTWCLVQKFDKALRHYSTFDPMDAKNNLRHLQRVKGLQDRAHAILKRLRVSKYLDPEADTFNEIDNSLI